MALLTDVLYGNRLYSQETYSSNEDPESLSILLSDSTPMTESTVDSINQVLADALSSSDALITLSIAALSDTITITEQDLFQIQAYLSDSINILDSRVAILRTKPITDFIILNEWISIVLAKANIWATQSAQSSTTTDEVLYSIPEYDRNLYSSSPITLWQQGEEASVIWTAENSTAITLPLYSQVLYAKSLYGSMPTVVWKDESIPVGENFTNFDGQGNVP